MKYRQNILTAATMLAAALYCVPAMAEGNPPNADVPLVEAGDQVPVSKLPDGIYLRTPDDTDDIIWQRIPEYRVHLDMAPPVHPSVDLRYDGDDPGEDLVFQLARTSDRFYVRLRWVDATQNIPTERDKFRDGVAIEFSNGTQDTSYMMGSDADDTVNIWYWHPDDNRVESLGAGGPGSITRLEEQPVTGGSQYKTGRTPEENQWVVVMSRPLKVDGDQQTSFDRETIPVSFAVWQGAKKQRDGLKYVTADWISASMANTTKASK